MHFVTNAHQLRTGLLVPVRSVYLNPIRIDVGVIYAKRGLVENMDEIQHQMLLHVQGIKLDGNQRNASGQETHDIQKTSLMSSATSTATWS